MKSNPQTLPPADLRPRSTPDPDIVDAFPFSFKDWLERPFPVQFTTLRMMGGTHSPELLPYQLSQKEMDRLKSDDEFSAPDAPPLGSTVKRAPMALLEKTLQDECWAEAANLSSEGRSTLLAAFARRAENYIEHLMLLADGGDDAAARHLAKLALKATKGLKAVESKHYKSLGSVAGYEFAWPALESPVKSLCSTAPDWEALGLGTDLNLNLGGKRRLKLDNPTGKLAWNLLNYVANLRKYARATKLEVGETTDPTSAHLLLTINAGKLGSLTSDYGTILNWWNVAEGCLIASYPAPTGPEPGQNINRHLADQPPKQSIDENDPVFAGIVTAPKDRRTAERHRSRIIEKLQERFCSIAGYDRVKKA